MYGLIVKLTAVPGHRDELIQVLGGDDSHTVPGCLSFISARDATDSNVLWVTEVWTSQADHEASVSTPPTKTGLPDISTLVAAYEKVATTRPVPQHSHPLHDKAPL